MGRRLAILGNSFTLSALLISIREQTAGICGSLLYRAPLVVLILVCIGCDEPHRRAGEEDRTALEAQAKGAGCTFRSSLLQEGRSSLTFHESGIHVQTSSRFPEQGQCYVEDSLLAFFDPGELGCRRHAIDCLARLPHSSLSIPTLTQVAASPLPEHDWAGVRREDLYATLAFALGTTNDERATPVLIAMLKLRESQESVVAAALNVLARLGTQEAILNQLLATPLETSRGRGDVLTAITSVSKLPSVSPSLCKSLVQLTRVSNLSIAEKSYKVLAARCQGEFSTLAQAAEDAVSSVAFRRRIATEFLGEVFAGKGSACPHSVTRLLSHLKNDSAPTVRTAAESARRQIGTPKGSTEPPAELLEEENLRRNRALHDIAAKALRIGTLRSRFTGRSHGNDISGMILSTAREQHRVEKTAPFNGVLRQETSSYVGNDEWTIATDLAPTPSASREIRRRLTSHQTHPPFTPLLMIKTNTDGSIDIDSLATFDGKEWLTEYSFIREELIHGEPCYLFEYQSDSNRVLKWISAKLGVLCKEESYYSEDGSTIAGNETPHQLVEYSDFEINLPVPLAEILVQPKQREVVHEYRSIDDKNSEREFVWQD